MDRSSSGGEVSMDTLYATAPPSARRGLELQHSPRYVDDGGFNATAMYSAGSSQSSAVVSEHMAHSPHSQLPHLRPQSATSLARLRQKILRNPTLLGVFCAPRKFPFKGLSIVCENHVTYIHQADIGQPLACVCICAHILLVILFEFDPFRI